MALHAELMQDQDERCDTAKQAAKAELHGDYEVIYFGFPFGVVGVTAPLHCCCCCSVLSLLQAAHKLYDTLCDDTTLDIASVSPPAYYRITTESSAGCLQAALFYDARLSCLRELCQWEVVAEEVSMELLDEENPKIDDLQRIWTIADTKPDLDAELYTTLFGASFVRSTGLFQKDGPIQEAHPGMSHQGALFEFLQVGVLPLKKRRLRFWCTCG